MSTYAEEDAGTGASWQGFHHAALVRADLDATVRFCGEVLGMEVGRIMPRDARGGSGRHCFIRPGGSESRGMHSLESSDARAVHEPEDLESPFDLGSVGAHHVAFGLPDGAAGDALGGRLERNGVEATPAGDAGPVRNGLLLEATWPRA